MSRETGGIFLLVLGLVALLFVTTPKGRAVWQLIFSTGGATR